MSKVSKELKAGANPETTVTASRTTREMVVKYKIDRGVEIRPEQLQPNPWNPNKVDLRTQNAIQESLETYGQVIELLVRPHPEQADCYQIIDGEHRSRALSETVFVNVIHGLGDADAKKLTVILNETKGSADKIELAQLLASIKDDLGDDLILGLPYSDAELDELVKLADVNWDEYADAPGESGTGSGGGDDEWVSLSIKIPAEAYEVFRQAYDLIADERTLHKDKAIALGQVIESLAADYLASPR